MSSSSRRPPDGPEHPKPPRLIAPAVVGALVLAGLVALFVTSPGTQPARATIAYRPTFLRQLEHGNVKAVTSRGSTIEATLRKPIAMASPTPSAATAAPLKGGTSPAASPAAQRTSQVMVQVPAFADRHRLTSLLAAHDVRVTAQPASRGGGSSWVGALTWLMPLLLIGGLLWFALRRRAGSGGDVAGGGVMGGFARSRHRRAEGQLVQTTFDDVAGIDEAKADLRQIVAFLRDPSRYARLGGRIPRGVLLAGAPGTGKTLLARAVAGEAGVPFFQISASEFVEMIVGVGAARVRDLFASAKAEAAAIVFIDELDAIGRKRGAASGVGGSHEEREQTLNQILTEMDGFETGTNVIVMAATNRPEILDPALLRPGRFDRHVEVAAPDRRGRRQILAVHTAGKPLAADVDLGALARTTPGMVGADLANLVNEAALLAAERSHRAIAMDDFGAALEKLLLGAERTVLLGEEDRRRLAYHEAGHAIVGMLTPHADPVRKVTIVPRGRALGVTLATPDTDQLNYERDALLARILVALGGRVAEEIVFGSMTTGAENDIEQLTQLARRMVGRWGMSETIGPIAVMPADDDRSPFGVPEISSDTQCEVDREVRRIIDDAHGQVARLLNDNRARLDALAAALLEHETLDQHAAWAAAHDSLADRDGDRVVASGGD